MKYKQKTLGEDFVKEPLKYLAPKAHYKLQLYSFISEMVGEGLKAGWSKLTSHSPRKK